MTATTIDEVIQNLDIIIQTSIDEESTLGYFAALYQKVTKKVESKLGTDYFDDDVRMEQLDVIFANRYLQAYSDFKEGNTVSESWEVAFNASENSNLIVLQHLLLGMNAHINLDLGVAAAEISDRSMIDDLQPDFNRINELLSSLVDEVENDLSEIWPTFKKILRFFKKADKFIINFSMSLARDGAWRFANELVLESDDAALNNLIKLRDQKTANQSGLIVDLGVVERIIFAVIRYSEKGKPSDKIEALRG